MRSLAPSGSSHRGRRPGEVGGKRTHAGIGAQRERVAFFRLPECNDCNYGEFHADYRSGSVSQGVDPTTANTTQLLPHAQLSFRASCLTLGEDISIPADIDLEEIRRTIRRELARVGESRYHRRLHGVLLVASGLSPATVATALGDDPRTVQRWIKRYKTNGLDGLRDRVRPGRPATLDARQRASLAQDLDRRPAEFGLPGRTWSGTTLATYLRERYDTTLGIRQCQRLLNELRDHAGETAKK